MLAYKDSQDHTLHIEDKVTDLVTNLPGIVLSFWEGQCQVLLENSELHDRKPEQLVQVDSVYERLVSMKTKEDLAKLFEAAKANMSFAKPKKASSGSRTKKPADSVEEEFGQ